MKPLLESRLVEEGEGCGSCLDGSMPNACSECVVLFGRVPLC